MIRSLMQTYVKNSIEAVELYKKAFDAELISEYKNSDGSYYHSELNVYGQVLAVSEGQYFGSFAHDPRQVGNTMQFCLHFGADEKVCVEKAYELMKEEAQILFPLGPCDFSSCMADFIDKFGVRWCLFTDN